ncbi:cbb3-type cytochrome c oxidase subunit I, partial [uncultured Schumannella sp.]|uniref:cbb3-type cytochrome c oxidase subunit I n=1 Tax=uncultured Schumannella sp. TaxID=1195956 RepID=UPI0025D5EEBA
MSTATATPTSPTGTPAVERKANVFVKWITTTDHKTIGYLYLITSFIYFLIGGVLALVIRAELFTPGVDLVQSNEQYNQLFTMHGTIMLLMFATPLFAGFANVLMPLQIGAPDVAFPRLNALAYWFYSFGSLIAVAGFFTPQGAAGFGWTAYTPLSSTTFSPGLGGNLWVFGLALSGFGTILGAVNFITTIITMRAPGMTMWRMPIFTWNALVTSILVLLAFPVLAVGLFALGADRVFESHLLDPANGGTILWQHLFWFFGHPEVYIIALPFFGIVSEVFPVFSRKPIFGYKTLVYATIAIAALSVTVWAHHMYVTGSVLLPWFALMTMLIAVPTGVKIFDWLFTMYRGRVRFSQEMHWTLGFIVTFVIGGVTGVLLAMPPADYLMHNTTFLVAHFHNMLIPGALFGYFAGYQYWFPKAIGFKLDERWGKAAFWCWMIGFYLAFMPLYALGFMGMPRRMEHYDNPAWQPYLIVAAIGAVVIFIGLILMVVQLVVSARQREKLGDTTGDPWNGRTLEWLTSSPP